MAEGSGRERLSIRRAGRTSGSPLRERPEHGRRTTALAAPVAFSRALRQGPATGPTGPLAIAIFAAPGGGIRPPGPHRFSLLLPGGVACRCPRIMTPCPHGERCARSFANSSGSPPTRSGSRPLQLASFDGEQLTLTAPAGTRQWVSARYGRLLDRCARRILGDGVTVAFSEEPARSGGSGSRPPPARDGTAAGSPGELQPPLHLRAVRHRRGQPARPRGRAEHRRDAGRHLQPASSCTRRRAWARPTCCTRSATTSTPSGPAPASATRPPRPSPTTSWAR